MGKLEGKIALITGGNSGIGLATAKQFVNEGAYVFITGRRDPELAAAIKEIGRNVIGVQGDVANLGDLDRLFAQIKREKGKLDIVFANAGVAKYAAFGEINEDHYDSIFGINVKGLLFTVQKALPLMPDGSSIILNASIVEGKSRREAARVFGLSRDTIAKMRRYSAPPGYVRSKSPERPKLGPLVPVIDAILEADKTAPPKQRHTAKRIFERPRLEHDFAGGYTAVKDHVRIVRTISREVFVPLAHPPGHARGSISANASA
jgi:NAD(P)-dependent dehydrogenase (short-subunit alcohol dehydrogenase family)